MPLSKTISFSLLILLDRQYLKTCVFGTSFILFVLKNEIFSSKDYKVYHYGITYKFLAQNTNVIV